MPNGSPLLKIPVASDPEPPPIAMAPPPLAPSPPTLAAPSPPPLAAPPPLMNAPPMKEVAAQLQQGAQVAKAETAATLRAMQGTFSRLLAFGRSGYEQRQLSQQLLEAQETLGQKMERAGLGDPGLRAQLAHLVERRKSVEAAHGPVKVLDAERRGLHLRLAEPYLHSVQPPPGLESEHRWLLELKQELEATSARLGEQRTSLLPGESRDRMRVLAGGGAVAILLLLGMWMFWPGGEASWRSARRSRSVLPQPLRDKTTIQPTSPQKEKEAAPPAKPDAAPVKRKESPAAKSADPMKVEKWMEANDYFPRRKVVATYVKDQPQGEVKFYDAQDRLIGVEHYNQGMLHGKRVCYYPSGKKFSETTFQNGAAHGASTTWFENGKVASTVEFVNGEITGKSVTYFSNGNKSVVSDMVNGVRHGESTHFRPDGQPFAAVDWVNGVEVNRQVVLEVTQQDLAVINERSDFSALLKDWWR
jgi:hypothetical protein